MSFFQQNWEIIKGDLMALFKEFHRISSFAKSMNSNFLILIPKVEGALNIKDFRPVNLVSGVYKIMVKLLSQKNKRKW